MSIKQNVVKILGELPPGVQLVSVTKGRGLSEMLEAIDAGVRIIGENYVQEAEKAREVIGGRVEWHFIGHLQQNKVKKAVLLFNMIETVDSCELALEIDRRCAALGKVMPVLIEINSGRETQKSGVLPENAAQLIHEIATLKNIRVMGLMTMGLNSVTPEDARPCFAETRRTFENIRTLNLPGVEMRHLSMGMSSSYRIAIEEGANIIRIGARIFGEED